MTILNYQGSKKNLLNFLHKNLKPYLTKDKVFLDIFSGTGSVGYSFKRYCNIFANDLELYSYHISNALLSDRLYDYDIFVKDFKAKFIEIEQKKFIKKKDIILMEEVFMKEDVNELYHFYQSIPTIWNNKIKPKDIQDYNLFLYYYAGSYFGVKQSIHIDIIREIIDYPSFESFRSQMLTASYFAMKEVVFSKDGHMAQPLNVIKNRNRLLKVRNKDVLSLFLYKMKDFFSDDFVLPIRDSKVYNMNFKDLILTTNILDNVDVVYADPPYTDMQYSRYYHILNVFTKYDYPNPTHNNGQFTKGKYTENRNQSKLSQKSRSLDELSVLISSCFDKEVTLIFSFAYPIDEVGQKTNRYVFNIKDLIEKCTSIYGDSNVNVVKESYNHSNNRNSHSKKVNEYLVICEAGDKYAY